MLELRTLSPSGIGKFSEYLDNLAGSPKENPPFSLLTESGFTEAVPGNLLIDQSKRFYSKMAAAEYLSDIVGKIDATLNVRTNPGLWTWLALCYFDQLCPVARDGSRKADEKVRYIFPDIESKEHWRRYYRHLLAGPYEIYSIHQQNGRLLLEGPLNELGDITEQLASRMEIISNKNVIRAADLLYYDKSRKAPKIGATNRNKLGNLRRFVAITLQFDLTYDLYAMNERDIVKLLPPEFDSWKRH